jgi:hypothetical protein
MKYILKYHLFEGRIDPKETYRRREIVSYLIKNSNSMANIKHLFPDRDDIFHIDTVGNIIFGTILRAGSVGKSATINKNSPVGKCKAEYISPDFWGFKGKTFDSLEECLRCIWASVVASRMSSFVNREVMFHKLYDERKYWNENLTMWQILRKEVPNVIDGDTTVSNEISKINEWLDPIGLNLGYWFNDKREYFTCVINRTDVRNEAFIKLKEFAKIYDPNFGYVSVAGPNKANFPIKTMNVKDEVHTNLRKMNFIKLEGSDSKELKKLYILCYRKYIDYMFYNKEFSFKDLYGIIASCLTLKYTMISYLKKNNPELLDVFSKNMSGKDIELGGHMGDMGFGDD